MIRVLALSLCVFALHASESARVLMPLANGFNNTEFVLGYYPLVAHGYQVDVAQWLSGDDLRTQGWPPDKRGRDMKPTILLDDIPSADDYLGMMIAGGYSPGYLEKSPKAIALTREFMTGSQAGQCHLSWAQTGGPSCTVNRMVASWMGLADELPDAWVNGEVGIYRDEAVVVDGNLITARYPNDTEAFTQEFMRHTWQQQGGLPMPKSRPMSCWSCQTSVVIFNMFPVKHSMSWDIAPNGSAARRN